MGSGFAGRESEGQRQDGGPVTKVLEQVWGSQVEMCPTKKDPSRRRHRGCEQEVRGTQRWQAGGWHKLTGA